MSEAEELRAWIARTQGLDAARVAGLGRKEFFYATPAEVRDALQRFAGQHLIEFTEEPQALEWRAGRRMGEAGAPAAGAGGVAARTA
ncbi:hypothetical protein ACFY3E_32925 [Streptomyces griseorubiginosus]|uniref:hypothetical protein n=1 Tax=Streptomyces griseorubiginosus TaxID=67304 RepID=UPI0036A0584A